MNHKLQPIQDIIRQLHLLRLVEHLRYWIRRCRMFRANRQFQQANPDFALPPAHLAFDAYGTVHWETYHGSGVENAKNIVGALTETQQNVETVLEWGCGPARVIRHLPALLPGAKVFGSDYNTESIEWCTKHIPGITFVLNELDPPLPFEESQFDFIYAISVFTHLSEDLCLKWIDELSRILKPGGILMIWTNGDCISDYTLPKEKEKYENSQFVVRDKYAEGKKMFLSFHPPEWVQNTLLKKYSVEKHYPGGFTGSQQDVWLARSCKSNS